MKISVLFLFCVLSLFNVLNIQVQKVKVLVVFGVYIVQFIFDMIEGQMDYDFFYSNNYINLDCVVYLIDNVKDVNIIFIKVFCGIDVMFLVLDKWIIFINVFIIIVK